MGIRERPQSPEDHDHRGRFADFNFTAIVLVKKDATGIENVANSKEQTANSLFFNLAGQRVPNPGKGLYIVNGKKVIMK